MGFIGDKRSISITRQELLTKTKHKPRACHWSWRDPGVTSSETGLSSS